MLQQDQEYLSKTAPTGWELQKYLQHPLSNLSPCPQIRDKLEAEV